MWLGHVLRVVCFVHITRRIALARGFVTWWARVELKYLTHHDEQLAGSGKGKKNLHNPFNLS
jgi:hypothetical protein